MSGVRGNLLHLAVMSENVVIVGGAESELRVLGLNVYAAVLDEANFVEKPSFPVGTPVQHRDHEKVVGVVSGHFFDKKRLNYVVDWLTEGFAPNVRKSVLRELPSEMHLLALACA